MALNLNAGDIFGFLDPSKIVPVIFNIVAIAGFAFILFLLVKRMFNYGEVIILDSQTREAKKDWIRISKDKKTGEKKTTLHRAKDHIMGVENFDRFKCGRKYWVPLVRGRDGYIRPAFLVDDYEDKKGVIRPYIRPTDGGLKDHIFHLMLQKTGKYKLTSTLERLAPYGVMAMTVMVVIISIYLHNKAVA